jgi:hypothetical protein
MGSVIAARRILHAGVRWHLSTQAMAKLSLAVYSDLGSNALFVELSHWAICWRRHPSHGWI